MFVVFLLSVLSCHSGETLRVISTDPSASLPRLGGLAVVQDSSIQHLEEFTVCLRFKTYNFDVSKEDGNRGSQSVISIKDFNLLASYLAVQCEEGCEDFPKSFIPNWKRGKVYGRTTNNENMFPGWLPLQWRSVCMSSSHQAGSWTLSLDGRDTARFQYDGYHKRSPGNILLMNIDHKVRRLQID